MRQRRVVWDDALAGHLGLALLEALLDVRDLLAAAARRDDRDKPSRAAEPARHKVDLEVR